MNNILQLIDGGFIGGGQTHILSLCKNIKDSFNIIIAANPGGKFKELVNEKCFKFRDIVLPKLFRLKHLQDLVKIVEEEKISLIHSHGGVAGVYARMLKKHHPHIKVVHTIHGIHYINKNFLTRFLSLTMEQYLVKYSDKIICVSDTDYKKALRFKIADKDKTVIIKNGIDLKRFSTQKDAQLLKQYGFTEEDIIFGNISRFDYQKNQRLILTQAPEIIKAVPDAKFMLIGSGEYLDECRYLADILDIKDKIVFTGEVNDVENYYPLFDIFVFPSLWEGLSITLLEAMASRCCILASGIAENEELINNGINGLTYNPGARKDFKEKAIYLAGNSKLRQRLASQAYKDVQEFEEQIMAQKIQQVYNEVLT